MTIAFHLNNILLAGLCLMPASFILAVMALVTFQHWELAALVPAAYVFIPTMTAGIVLTILGIGMDIH